MRALGLVARTTLTDVTYSDCIVVRRAGYRGRSTTATGVLFDLISSLDSRCNYFVLRRYVCPDGCIIFRLTQFQFNENSLCRIYLRAPCRILHATITRDSKMVLALM